MRGKCSPKVTTKKGASKNQSPTIASPATGKKRKKKQLKGETGKGIINLKGHRVHESALYYR